MTGHRKDKKPTPSGGGCPIVLVPVLAVAALLLRPRYLRTHADLYVEAARLNRPPLWRRALRLARDCPYCEWPGSGHAPTCPRA